MDRQEEIGRDRLVNHILVWGLWLALAGLLLTEVGHALNRFAIYESFQLNPRKEDNLLTWIAVSATSATAVLAATRAAISPVQRRPYLVVAVIVTYFSLDDGLIIHERLEDHFGRLVTDFVVLGPLSATAFLLLLALSFDVPARIARRMRWGLLGLGVAIFGDFTGFITRHLHDNGVYWPNSLRQGAMFGGKVSGWILMASAMAAIVSVTAYDIGRSEASQ